MKRFLLAAIIAAFCGTSHAADVGVSINIGPPIWGRLDMGGYPQPVVIYPEPVVIQPAPVIVAQPVYLHVPPGHAKNWAKHCHKYRACGDRVYFVQESWYQDVYAPRYYGPRGKGHGKGHKHD
jgi:hypothetical protein